MDIPLIYKRIEEQLSNQLPFVVYRSPGSQLLQSFFQKNDTVYFQTKVANSGFVFAPFDHQKKAVLFPLEHCDCIKDVAVDIKEQKRSNSLSNVFQKIENKIFKKNHIDLVERGKKAILNGAFKKVVLSRKEEVIQNKSIDLLLLFKRLLTYYPNAFVYLWYHPKIGSWIGGTPETLLRSKDRKIRTMALAGTLPFEEGVSPQWTDKEVVEQQIVTDFIVDRLDSISSNITISDTFTHRAGALLHLRTDIEATLENTLEIDSMINHLHPTPAVCGLPTDKAKKFIIEEEGYDRKFYTGFLGELNLEKENAVVSNLYVNLRCMEIKGDAAIIYVGGGITADSDPEKEWQETLRKTSTMKKVLG